MAGCALAQDKAVKLDEKRGFKNIKLGESVTSYKAFIEPVKGSKTRFSVKDSTMLKIGTDIRLSNIIIETYNDKVYKISVLALPQYSFKFRSVLISAYGAWSIQPNKFQDKYIWYSPTKKVELLYNGESTNKWCYATFKDMDLDVIKKQADKEKISNAANDL